MLGLVTIGQAPRDDVVASMFGSSCPDIVQTGALDGLEQATIDKLRPVEGEQPLVTRLTTGEQVWLSKARVLPYLQTAVERLETDGAQLICVLCTGAFPGLHASGRLVFPDQLLRAVVDVLAPAGVLGVLMPDPGQASMMQSKWRRAGRTLALASASPYQAGEAAFASATEQLVRQGADLIVLDCMGFTRAMHDWVAAYAQVSVVLSNGLVGAVLREAAGLRVGLDQPLQVQPAHGLSGRDVRHSYPTG